MPNVPRPAREHPIPPMDHEPGDKDTAFTPEMGRLILRRIGEGETMKAITADPRMPAYCTVFRWMQVVPEFGDAVRALRAEMAAAKIAAREDAQWARMLSEPADRRSLGLGGQRSTFTREWAEAVCVRVEAGAPVSAVLGQPGMPSVKAFYRWLRNEPWLRWRYAEACELRDIALEMARDDVINGAWATGIVDANAALREIDGRRGRLTPKLYRRAWEAS